MKCTKHPRYIGIRYPRANCAACLKIWRYRLEHPRKRRVQKEVRMECKKHPWYKAEEMPTITCKNCMLMWLESPHRLPCDARNKADCLSFGGTDAGGRARM